MPQLNEQKKISHILSIVDHMRKKDKESEEIVRRVKQGSMGEVRTRRI
jgi:restriction endonuclease S subunit